MKTDTGYAGIYCHSDGYLDRNGTILLDHYQDAEKVARLIALGDISRLCREVEPEEGTEHSFRLRQEGVTVAYMRDRGEAGCEACTGPTEVSVSTAIAHNGHVYVFENGKWTHNGTDLAIALGESAA
jgi:hypothetical protein